METKNKEMQKSKRGHEWEKENLEVSFWDSRSGGEPVSLGPGSAAGTFPA